MIKTLEKTSTLEKALQLVGKKYNLLILDSLLQNRGKRRFNQFLSEIPSLNPRILSMRLKDLEKGGLLNKSLILGTPVKTEYQLTERAEKLSSVIQNLKEWVVE